MALLGRQPYLECHAAIYIRPVILLYSRCSVSCADTGRSCLQDLLANKKQKRGLSALGYTLDLGTDRCHNERVSCFMYSRSIYPST